MHLKCCVQPRANGTQSKNRNVEPKTIKANKQRKQVAQVSPNHYRALLLFVHWKWKNGDTAEAISYSIPPFPLSLTQTTMTPRISLPIAHTGNQTHRRLKPPDIPSQGTDKTSIANETRAVPSTHRRRCCRRRRRAPLRTLPLPCHAMHDMRGQGPRRHGRGRAGSAGRGAAPAPIAAGERGAASA